MSNNNYILELLNIKDKNIFISTELINKIDIKGKTNKIIRGILTYKPDYCPCCGIVNQSFDDIIKWGFKKNCKIKIPKISNCNSILFLDKQRFLCKHCSATFVAETDFVKKHCNISNNTDTFIRTELMTKSSMKDIAERANVSTSSVEEVLKKIESKTILRHPTLPKAMLWDEFKATKDTKGKMAFMIMDYHKATIFDIQDSRMSRDLFNYFSRYPRIERNKVEFISTDFFPGYIKVAKSLFKNADIVIDRFHIVVQIYVALNTARVNLCKKSNPNYNKLKKYWKLILKDENELTDQKKYSYHFKKDVSQRDIVSYLINTDQHLKANYECYQGLLNTIKTKDLITFKAIVTNQNKDLHIKMTKALKLFRENMKYIENSFKYEINNGMIEGTNNLIKTIKRIAFGYRKYNIFKARIMLIKGIVKG